MIKKIPLLFIRLIAESIILYSYLIKTPKLNKTIQEIMYRNYLGKSSGKGRSIRNKKSMVKLHKDGKLICGYCNTSFDFVKTFPTIDHIIPKSKNGANCKENLTPCCKPCNMTKGKNIWEVKYYNKGFGLYGKKKLKN